MPSFSDTSPDSGNNLTSGFRDLQDTAENLTSTLELQLNDEYNLYSLTQAIKKLTDEVGSVKHSNTRALEEAKKVEKYASQLRGQNELLRRQIEAMKNDNREREELDRLTLENMQLKAQLENANKVLEEKGKIC